jgi:hypothetical protein
MRLWFRRKGQISDHLAQILLFFASIFAIELLPKRNHFKKRTLYVSTLDEVGGFINVHDDGLMGFYANAF